MTCHGDSVHNNPTIDDNVEATVKRSRIEVNMESVLRSDRINASLEANMEAGVRRVRMKSKGTMKQYRILRTLVPTISEKRNVSKLEVIEETVRYIEELQNRLIDSIGEAEAHHKMAETANFTLNQIEVHQDENQPKTTSPSRPSMDCTPTTEGTSSHLMAGSVAVRRRSSLSQLRQ